MKKNLLGWLAMATMLVGTGCSTDEVVNDYSPENAIQFGTYTGRDAQGRASVTDVTALQTSGFGVYAYLNANNSYATANFMKNIKVSTANWTYGPTKYWPNDTENELSFLAYGPYTNGTSNSNITLTEDTNADNSITFTVADAVKNQTDLVVAAPLKDLSQGNGTDGKVKFTFAHMLSRIAFSAKKTNAESATVTINKIELKGNFHKTGTVDMSADVPAITGTGTASEVTYTFTKGTDFTNAEAELESSAVDLTNGSTNYLMVIPSGSSQTYTITVNYTVSYSDGSASVTSEISSNQELEFGAGIAYKFNINVSLNEIIFEEPTVTSWTDGVSPNITI